MRTVAVAIVGESAVAEVVVGTGLHTPCEVTVRATDAGVKDIRRHAGTTGVERVLVVQWQRVLIDSVESPRRIDLLR